MRAPYVPRADNAVTRRQNPEFPRIDATPGEDHLEISNDTAASAYLLEKTVDMGPFSRSGHTLELCELICKNSDILGLDDTGRPC